METLRYRPDQNTRPNHSQKHSFSDIRSVFQRFFYLPYHLKIGPPADKMSRRDVLLFYSGLRCAKTSHNSHYVRSGPHFSRSGEFLAGGIRSRA